MSTNVGSIHYDLDLDTSGFDRAMHNMSSKLNDVGKSMQSVGQKMTIGLTLPVVVGAGFAIKAASDLNETINKIDVAFKDQAGVVKEWAKTSISQMGLARGTALDLAATFGDMASGMGFNSIESAKMSTQLVQLAADMSSFKNISIDQAKTALSGVFTGEGEALKTLGTIMNEATLEAFALKQGTGKVWKEMTQAEKVALRYKFVMDANKNSQGDFARTADGNANKMRMTSERVKELSSQIGMKLLPIAATLLAWANNMLNKFNELTPSQQRLIGIVIALAAAMGPLVYIIGTLATVVSFLISPVGLVIAGVALLAAGIAYLHTKFGILNPFINTMRQGIELLKPVVMSLWGEFQANLLPALQRLWELIGPVLIPILKAFGTIIAVTIIANIYVWINVIRALVSVLSWLINTVNSAVSSFWNFLNSVKATASQLWGVLSGAFSSIGKFFAGAGSWLYSAGKAVVQGFIDGIKSMVGAVANAGGNIADSVKNRVKSVLGIRSPSKVFKNFGMNVTQGFADGIGKGENMLDKVVNSMSGTVLKPTINPQIAPQGSTGNTNSININGNISLGDSRAVDTFFDRLNRNGELASKGMAII